MLIQAEAGVASVTGGPGGAGARRRLGLRHRRRHERLRGGARGADRARQAPARARRSRVSMFDGMADWMTTPLLQHEGGAPPKRIGLAHTSIAPYGVFKIRDGADILISIQSDREWRVLAEKVHGRQGARRRSGFRHQHRAGEAPRRDRRPGRRGVRRARCRRAGGEARGGRHRLRPRQRHRRSLRAHPHLRRITIGSPSGPLSYPAPAALWAGEPRKYGPVPAIGEHSDKIRAEFGRST